MSKSDLKSALPTLAHIDYKDVPTDNLEGFMKDVLKDAETIINSVPNQSASGSPSLPEKANTAKKPEDTISDPYPDNEIDARNSDLQSAWGKPVKVGQKDNPLGIAVYKMSGHDRHGAWFARRSTHVNIGFTRWKRNMQREFAESLKTQEGPGTGAVRGMAADRRLDKKEVEGLGKMEVYELSAVFGPVTPREFRALIITSENALGEASALKETGKPPRHFIVISRPTSHKDAPPRSDLVLGHYESIEMIRELPIAKEGADPETNPVEWIMITRSDPGGGIPRFMVERGTPGGIAGDTSKFLKWALERPVPSEEDHKAAEAEDEKANKEAQQKQAEQPAQPPPQTNGTSAQSGGDAAAQGGIFGTVAAYTESAVAAVAPSYLPTVQHALGTDATNEEIDDESDTSGSSGYTTAEESEPSLHGSPNAAAGVAKNRSVTMSSQESAASMSQSSLAQELASGRATPVNHQEKNVVKLSQKRNQLDEKYAQAKAESERKLKELPQENDHTRQKVEKERRKQDEKYQKEAEKLAKKQKKEAAKAEEKRQKALAKDELAQTKMERDQYKTENEALRKQLAELQRQHTLQSANTSRVDVNQQGFGPNGA